MVTIMGTMVTMVTMVIIDILSQIHTKEVVVNINNRTTTIRDILIITKAVTITPTVVMGSKIVALVVA